MPELYIIDQQRLNSVDMTDITMKEVVHLQQRHVIATCVLLLWKSLLIESTVLHPHVDITAQQMAVLKRRDDPHLVTDVAIAAWVT